MNNKPSPLLFGKIPPQAIEAEAAVLCAALSGRVACEDILEHLKTDDVFYKHEHRLIFAAILKLYNSGSQIDIITVTNTLRGAEQLDEVGGPHALMQLAGDFFSAPQTISHCLIVVEKWMKREVIRISGEAMAKAYEDGDAFEVIDSLEASIQNVSEQIVGDKQYSPLEVMPEVIDDIERNKALQGAISGVDTGIGVLNFATNGWQPTDHIIIAARPGNGKTAFVLNMILNAALAGFPVYIHSLEMGRKALVRRCLAILGGVDLKNIKNGQLSATDEGKLYKAMEVFGKLRITIDDKGGVTANQIIARARKWKRRNNIEDGKGLIAIDYLQLLRPTNLKDGRERQVAEMSWTIKTGAKELQLPIIDLCQMNRGVEQSKRRPEMSDLRESGAIENDADMIAFLHHEEDPNTGKVKNLFVIKKFRDGAVDTYELRFTPSIQKWSDLEDDRFETMERFNPYAGIAKNYYEKEEEPF